MKICKINNSSQYLSMIDINDADVEFYNDVLENSEDMYAIYYDDNIVGLANVICDVCGFLYIYIFLQNRNKGFGKAAVKLLEEQMSSSKLRDIATCYLSNNKNAYKFATACGYVKEFASVYMKFCGSAFENITLPIRQYRDEDYEEAQLITAEAFHKMRLETGYFPNSLPERPSVEMRKFWNDTAEERYVYIFDNEIIGYGHIDGDELSEVSIKITHQGKGFGTQFIKFLINRLLEKGYSKPYLYCIVGNKARNLYEALGFKEVCCNEYAKKKMNSL